MIQISIFNSYVCVFIWEGQRQSIIANQILTQNPGFAITSHNRILERFKYKCRYYHPSCPVSYLQYFLLLCCLSNIHHHSVPRLCGGVCRCILPFRCLLSFTKRIDISYLQLEYAIYCFCLTIQKDNLEHKIKLTLES